jgi:hypothetical protein
LRPIPIGRTRVLVRTLLFPRGWLLQNRARGEELLTRMLTTPLDPEHHRVYASAAREAEAEFRAMKRTPYTFLVQSDFPQFFGQTCRLARLQVGIDEARIACALERYRIAHRAYPDSLQALAGPSSRRCPWT